MYEIAEKTRVKKDLFVKQKRIILMKNNTFGRNQQVLFRKKAVLTM